MDSVGSGIPAFFAGRHVLVTGATGFMGKVLVEKLLRCCPDVVTIYVVVRPKRGLAATKRIEEWRRLPMFEPLLKKHPNILSKVHALEGETTRVNMGLAEEDQRLVLDKVSVVFHLAAALNWAQALQKSVKENVGGTKNVLNFCMGIKNLVALEYTSTTFCQCAEDVLQERLYPPPIDPHQLMDMAETLTEQTMEAMAKTLYGAHPNCYTFTKAVAEGLVMEYTHKLPLVVIRPSIVVPSLREPIPGWVDTLNGPMGVLAAAGKGVLRSMMCPSENFAEMMPVDVCINALIAATYKRALLPRSLPDVLTFNICTGSVEQTTWGEILEIGRRKLDMFPFEWTLWYPDGSIRTNWWAHTLIVFLFQMVPAYLIDALLFLLGQERFMVRVQRKIRSGHDLLAFFTMRQWKFDNRNGYETLWPTLNAQDKETFYMNNALPVDKEDFMGKAIFGARTYCLRESPDSLKYCRARIKVQRLVHRTCVALFYMAVAYLVFKPLLPLVPHTAAYMRTLRS